MDKSYYQIIKDKVIFSDRRFDAQRARIMEVFRITDIIETTYRPPTLSQVSSGNYLKVIDLHKNLRIKISDCRHKAEAVSYSLTLIQNEVMAKPSKEDMKSYSEMIASKFCNTAEIKNEVLIYEVESFLFQVKSNIDILIQLLKHLYTYLDKGKRYDSESFESENRTAGARTIKLMKDNGDNEIADYFENQVKNWLQEVNVMRDKITHRSLLKGFSSYIFDSSTDTVRSPKMPNGKEVDKYCQKIFIDLLSMYKEVFTRFVIPKNLEITNSHYA